MKRSLIVMLFVSFFAVNSFANDPTVDRQVIEKFSSDFPTATKATWTAAKDYYVVSFNVGSENRRAFYSQDGELIAVARTVLFTQMPLIAQQALMERFPQSEGYAFQPLEADLTKQAMEVNDERSGTYYLLKVETEKHSRYVRVTADGGLTIVRSVKK
jgi:hypothetical protein